MWSQMPWMTDHSYVAIQEHQTDPEPAIAALFAQRPTVVPGRVERSDLPGIVVVIDRDEARKYQASAAERPHLRTTDGSFTNW